jgi:hypothetical protein
MNSETLYIYPLKQRKVNASDILNDAQRERVKTELYDFMEFFGYFDNPSARDALSREIPGKVYEYP